MLQVDKKKPFEAIIDRFVKHNNLQRHTLQFLIDGNHLQPEEAPESYDMEDGDLVEVHQQQTGGGGQLDANYQF